MFITDMCVGLVHTLWMSQKYRTVSVLKSDMNDERKKDQ
jgi:hypothetical protein